MGIDTADPYTYEYFLILLKRLLSNWMRIYRHTICTRHRQQGKQSVHIMKWLFMVVWWLEYFDTTEEDRVLWTPFQLIFKSSTWRWKCSHLSKCRVLPTYLRHEASSIICVCDVLIEEMKVSADISVRRHTQVEHDAVFSPPAFSGSVLHHLK